MMNKFRTSEDGVPIVHQWSTAGNMEIKSYFDQIPSHDGIRIKGVDYISEIAVYTSAAANSRPTEEGNFLNLTPMHPSFWKGTRIFQMLPTYQRFKIGHIAFHYIPVCPATQNGMLSSVCTYDADLNIPTFGVGDSVKRKILAMEGAEMFNVYSPVSVGFTKNSDQLYYTSIEGGDVRLEVPGIFALISASGYSPFDGSSDVVSLGNIFVSYDITFEDRGLIDNLSGYASDTCGIPSSALNAIFEPAGAGSVIALDPVFFVDSIPVNSAYEQEGFILSCNVIGSDSAGYPNWEDFTGGTNLEFRTSSAAPIPMLKGTGFYLVFGEHPTLEQVSGWGVYSTLGAALSQKADTFWDHSYVGTNLISLFFEYTPFQYI